jgi:hypothetical protein
MKEYCSIGFLKKKLSANKFDEKKIKILNNFFLKRNTYKIQIKQLIFQISFSKQYLI